MFKVITAEEAANMIKSGSNIATHGTGLIGYPELISTMVEKRFLETGEPRDLTLWFSSGAGGRGGRFGNDHLAYEGLLKRVVAGFFAPTQALTNLIAEDKIEAFNLPLGVLNHLFRAAAGKKPGILSEIGLNTIIDPRQAGGKLNPRTKAQSEEMVELITLDDKEYLYYKAPQIDICFIRGTTADPNGNITQEKEAAFLEPFQIAMATKANGGIVICQVERLTDLPAHPHKVKVPGILIDYVVIDSNQRQMRAEVYNPAYTGEITLPKKVIEETNKRIFQEMTKAGYTKRSFKERIIARRAAMELRKGVVVNTGIGIPTMIGEIADEENISEHITLTVESGGIGGIPTTGLNFGATINPQVILEQPAQFDFYDGGGLDITFVGALEIDPKGNVNVSKIGSKYLGVGGFINLTQSSKKVVYCTPFVISKNIKVSYENDKLQITQDSSVIKKFKKQIGEIDFSGELAAKNNKEVLYITERCVFRLTTNGLVLTEIAPGMDLEKDILDQMEFTPLVSENLITMDRRIFTDEKLGILDLE